MTPVRGKKYTRQQIMQLLCVYHLKQNLRLSDVKALTGRDDVDFGACYAHLLEDKMKIRESVPPMLDAFLPYDSDAVSYTHLDVYKRQVGGFMLLCAVAMDAGLDLRLVCGALAAGCLGYLVFFIRKVWRAMR